MQDPAQLAKLVAWLAFALAFVFGAVANRVNFCTMGAIADIVNMGDWRRMRMWLLAIATAIAGAALLEAAGAVDFAKTYYTGAQVPWLSHLVGGFVFGFGMTISSGCGSKTLLRAGAGNLKSVVVMLVMGVAAYMTLKGLFAVWRVNALDWARLDVTPLGVSRSDVPTIVKTMIGGGAWSKLVVSLLVAIGLGVFVLGNRDFRDAREMIFGGIAIGAIVVGGWYVSGHIGHLAEDPRTLEETFIATNSGKAESFSFAAPVGYLLELLMFWSDQSKIVTFGIAGVLGMIAGSTAMALARKTFRWESFASVEDMVNHIVGGVLMGFGAVCALGCTIGQGLSGISTLAIGSIITFASIVAGGVAALKYQYWRVSRLEFA